MSYIDVMSAAAYGRYNRKLARMAGLTAAAYWSELLDIVGHVAKKQAFDEEGYFKVDRKYVEERTGIAKADQAKADLALSKLGVLCVHPADQDRIGVMCDEMFSLLSGLDTKSEKKAKALTKLTSDEKAERARKKRDGIAQRLKGGLKEEDPDLRQAYCGWIDVVVDKGVLKPVQVEAFRSAVDAYTADKKAKLEIIGICVTSGYREAQWGIGKYERIAGKERVSAVRLPDQKIATEDSVNKEISF